MIAKITLLLPLSTIPVKCLRIKQKPLDGSMVPGPRVLRPACAGGIPCYLYICSGNLQSVLATTAHRSASVIVTGYERYPTADGD